jgi:hypothetical protein
VAAFLEAKGFKTLGSCDMETVKRAGGGSRAKAAPGRK